MHFSTMELVAAFVFGGAASFAGGYFGGVALGAKDLGRDLAGFLGLLYGPAAGGLGVLIGVVCIAALSARS